tara:strand:- start:25 stop:276 length:252 start_codon:yes stop_codon:yes gene_type:complete
VTDLQRWLNPVDVDAKIRDQTVKSMAADLARGKLITQIAAEFDTPFSTVQGMLRDYIPTTKEINNFRMNFAAKKLKAKKHGGL